MKLDLPNLWAFNILLKSSHLVAHFGGDGIVYNFQYSIEILSQISPATQLLIAELSIFY